MPLDHFSMLDHTGDIGLLLTATSLTALFRQAALGFYSVLLVDPESVKTDERSEFVLKEVCREELLVSWLTELNYRFNVHQELYCDFDLQIVDNRLLAKLAGEKFDPARHLVAREIKAITFHELQINEVTAGHWQGQVIFDI